MLSPMVMVVVVLYILALMGPDASYRVQLLAQCFSITALLCNEEQGDSKVPHQHCFYNFLCLLLTILEKH